jgi:peroxiredoxin (alkyl hydroperoxide reductase subunit C)
LAAEIGKPAPDFSLPDQDNNKVSLQDLRGQKALVVFVPFPYTGTCDGELCAIRDDLADLPSLGAKVVAITTSPRPVHAKWAQEHGISFPLLSDFWPHGDVASKYGCFDEEVGCANRWTFILDAEGTVRQIVKTETRREARSVEDYRAALNSF